MAKSIKVDILFGFKTKVELSEEDLIALSDKNIDISPICYASTDVVNEYIVGKRITNLDNAGITKEIHFDFSEEAKLKFKLEIMKDLDSIGFDVGHKDFSLLVNTYYW